MAVRIFLSLRWAGSGPGCRRRVCVTNKKQARIQLTQSRSGASLTVATVGRACLREMVRYLRTVDRLMQRVCLAMEESLTRTQDRGQSRAEYTRDPWPGIREHLGPVDSPRIGSVRYMGVLIRFVVGLVPDLDDASYLGR